MNEACNNPFLPEKENIKANLKDEHDSNGFKLPNKQYMTPSTDCIQTFNEFEDGDISILDSLLPTIS